MASSQKILLVGICILVLTQARAQQQDSTFNSNRLLSDAVIARLDWQANNQHKAFPVKKFFMPAMLIAYGASTLNAHGFESINGEVKEAMFADHPHKKVSIDNYLQFAPAATVYSLNALGIQGKHNLRDRSMIFLMSNIMLNATVFSVKRFTSQLRPDGSAYSSFPSGHTAEAFANAEFLRMEYKDVSPWYGLAGYMMAATTGYLRMYNNKHWLSDVAAGAGIGIASTKLAYWLYPKIQHKLFKDKPVKTMLIPSYQQGEFNIGMVHRF